jgi:hypothetical protein
MPVLVYDESLYGDSIYGGYTLPPETTTLFYAITARIIEKPKPVPPIIDTIHVLLAERFAHLQNIIQVMNYLNKIEYASGSVRSPEKGVRLPNLDDDWGVLYRCARLTGESDEDYRARLMTRVKVLTGSGTISACREVIDSLIGYKNGTVVESMWPAKAVFSFSELAEQRAHRSRDLILSVINDLVVAGVTPVLYIPYTEYAIKSAIVGDATIYYSIAAALETDLEMAYGIDSLVAIAPELPFEIDAAVCKDINLRYDIKSAVQGLIDLQYPIRAAIEADLAQTYETKAAIKSDVDLALPINAAIKNDISQQIAINAAISREFELLYSLKAYCVLMGEQLFEINAAIESSRALKYSIRARII